MPMASRALSALFGADAGTPTGSSRRLIALTYAHMAAPRAARSLKLSSAAVSLWIVVPLCCWLFTQWRAGAFRAVRPCPCAEADSHAQNSDEDSARVTQLSARNAQGSGTGARRAQQSRGQSRPDAQSPTEDTAGASAGHDDTSPGSSAGTDSAVSKSSARFVSGSVELQALSEGGWACPQCTLQNSAGDQICQACGAPKPTVVV